MRKLLTLLPLALAATACQHAAPATQGPAVVAAAPAVTVRSAPVWPPLPSLFAAADTLTPAMWAVVRQNNLAKLWQSPSESALTNLGIFEGFFGPKHYHFALVITQIVPDAADPAVYHVAGKTRYFPSHGIRPFEGTITMRHLRPLTYPGFLAAQSRTNSQATDSLAGRMYTAYARLQLREEPSPNSGLFEGEALLDFYTVPGQKPDYVHVFDHEGPDNRLPTRGGGVLLRGSRRNLTTGQVKPFAVSPYLPAVTPNVLKDFLLDERMGTVNPRYIHLGWDEYWNNDEWWADSPDSKLSL